MTCDEYKRALHGYFTGTLDPALRPEVDEHAASCGPCGDLMRTAQELTCQEFTEFLIDYIDERMPRERHDAFERHLAICPDCTHYLQSYRATMHMSVWGLDRTLPGVDRPLPPDLIQAIVEAIAKDKKS